MTPIRHGSGVAGDDFSIQNALPGDLTGEEDPGVASQLQGWGQECGRVDVGDAVYLSVAEKLGLFESRDHAKDALLLAVLQVILESTFFEK